MAGEPMTEAEAEAEAEARERLVIAALNRQRSAVEGWYVPVALAEAPIDAILATTDALAVLLNWHELGKRATPEQLTALLRGAEEAGRATCHVDWVTTKVVPLIPQMNEEKRVENWRIVPDEEGAT